MKKTIAGLLMLVSIVATSANADGFDKAHSAWDKLVSRHAQWSANGTTSSVDYAGFAKNSKSLDGYLDSLSKIDQGTFQAWNKNDREAFLINAYNAATIKLILTRYPDLKSIKDLGGLFSSPWKKEFVDLLGQRRSLDTIEHELLRGASDYSDPRIHFAVNCASIGCPALRPEAYVGTKLRNQLQDQTDRFLKDHGRNRLASDGKSVQVSKIFDWYADDFDAHADGVGAFLADHADALGLDAAKAQMLREGKLSIDFTDYDWSLNDTAH